jgi:GR25 family glycosyltransferase involved in LPS biosynthesis
MKTYIIHYTKGNGPTVRKEMEKSFPDAHFITQYDREDLFCSWIKFRTGSKLCPTYISCNVKHLEALKDMVDNQIEEAFIFEDDAVLIKDWESIFMEHKKKYFDDADYIKMGCLHELSIEKGSLTVTNNGGTEGQYVTLKFATEFLKNVNMENTIDLMHHGILGGGPVPCIPVCAQTSIISRGDTDSNQTDPLPDWREYIKTYMTRTRFNYDNLLKDYENFKKRKVIVENLFFERYSKRIDIKRIEYIYRNEFTV